MTCNQSLYGPLVLTERHLSNHMADCALQYANLKIIYPAPKRDRNASCPPRAILEDLFHRDFFSAGKWNPTTDPTTEFAFRCRVLTSDLCSDLAHLITKVTCKSQGINVRCCGDNWLPNLRVMYFFLGCHHSDWLQCIVARKSPDKWCLDVFGCNCLRAAVCVGSNTSSCFDCCQTCP